MKCSKMFNVSTVGHTAHIKLIVQFLPNAFQHCVVDGCNRFCYSGLQFIHVIWKGRHIDQSIHKLLQKEIARCEIWEYGGQGKRTRSSRPDLFLYFCYFQAMNGLCCPTALNLLNSYKSINQSISPRLSNPSV